MGNTGWIGLYYRRSSGHLLPSAKSTFSTIFGDISVGDSRSNIAVWIC